MKTFEGKVPLALAVFLLGPAGAAGRQEQSSNEREASRPVLEEIVVVGTRRRDASLENVPVPIDVVSGEDLMNQGATDLDDLLRGHDAFLQRPAARHRRRRPPWCGPATLRGLPPDSALVLVNEKRRHRSGGDRVSGQFAQFRFAGARTCS